MTTLFGVQGQQQHAMLHTATPCECAHRATKLTEEMPDQKKTRALAAKATVSHTASWMPLSVGRVCVWRRGGVENGI